MKRTAAALAAALALTWGVGCEPATETPVIRVDGSSTVFVVAEALAEEFQKSKQGDVRVTVGKSGSGSGFRMLGRGEIDIADASRPISAEEIETCRGAGIEFIELPICIDALTVAVHRDNDWCDSLTVEELKKIWEPESEGKITRWNQIRPEWPDEEFKLYGPGADSGTFDYFTEVIVGKARASRSDFTPSEDDNVIVQGIEGDKYSLGYVPFAYFVGSQDKMKAVAVQSDGEPVLPSEENVLNGTYQPLSRPLFVYVNRKSADRPEVKEYLEYMLANVADLAKSVKYVPLQEAVYERAKERFTTMQTGSDVDEILGSR